MCFLVGRQVCSLLTVVLYCLLTVVCCLAIDRCGVVLSCLLTVVLSCLSTDVLFVDNCAVLSVDRCAVC